MKLALYIGSIAWISATMISCTPETGTIKGTIDGAGGKTIYFQRISDNQMVTTDSSAVNEQGQFRILPDPALDLNFYRLYIDDDHFTILLTDSSENIEITASYEDFGFSDQVIGSPNSAALTSFYGGLRDLNDKRNRMRQEAKTFKGTYQDRQAKIKEAESVSQEIEDYCVAFVNEQLPSPVSMIALSELNMVKHADLYDKVLSRLKGSFDHTQHYKMVAEQFNNSKKQQELTQKPAKKNSKYTIGMEAPEIEMEDPNGKLRRLSDYKGKVVMIDFWASWCGPCRRENPNVIKVYDKYHKDGFEILSVSLDNNVDRWKSAIEKDQLTWDGHVSDLQGWKNAAAQNYGVSSIPHTILVGTDGKIIATHLRGPALESELSRIFGH